MSAACIQRLQQQQQHLNYVCGSLARLPASQRLGHEKCSHTHEKIMQLAILLHRQGDPFMLHHKTTHVAAMLIGRSHFNDALLDQPAGKNKLGTTSSNDDISLQAGVTGNFRD